jgi:predicted DsbA family dithiol-disulfide isomerase
MASTDKIQVEIWSDVQCPFCYIGKRQFETALAEFEDKDRVEVTWRSYQLDPSLKAQAGESIYAYLARRKGFSLDQSKQMHVRVAQSAASVGLDYQFDKMIVANSHASHRLIQAAKAQGKGDEAEEALFHAYFTEGKDLGDQAVLAALGESIGLTTAQALDALEDPQGTWGQKVDAEASEAAELGSTGVPFFVFDRQFAVTGAQGVPTFKKVLEKVAQGTSA